jgi:pimeloyl-ACP methyl ester carboxylesterase
MGEAASYMSDSREMQEFTFSSGRRRLVGRIFEPSGAGAGRRSVLFVHGQGSNQKGYEHRARLVSLNLDAVCLTFDLSGHGNDAANFCRYSVGDHLDDVVAAFDYLASQPTVDRMRVGVCGASYGGYLAALLTAHRAVKRLILRAPSLSFSPCQQPPSVSKEVPERFDSLTALGSYVGEVLILESELDEVVPSSHIAAYLCACSHAKHKVIPGATHALTKPLDAIFVNAIVKWFRSL